MNNFANIISTLKIYIYKYFVNIASVQLSCVQLFETLQHARSPCPIPTLWVYPNSCPLSQWCHRTISSSVVPFSSCLQSFLVSGSFPMNQFFALGSQSIGISASASVPPTLHNSLWFQQNVLFFLETLKVKINHVWLFATPWTVVHQAPLSMGFSRKEHCLWVFIPSSRGLPNPGIKPGYSAFQADS